MIKLRILKFLGKFIPYFRKRMLRKNTCINYINKEVYSHLNSYDKHSSFKLSNSRELFSNTVDKQIKFVYSISFEDIEMLLNINYENKSVIINFNFIDNGKSFNSYQLAEISELIKHFDSLNKSNLLLVFNLTQFD